MKGGTNGIRGSGRQGLRVRSIIARGLLRLDVVSQGVYAQERKRLELPLVEEALSLPSHP